MSKTKKALRGKTLRQIDVIKTLRREMPPKGKVILTKKDIPYRKRKHKGKVED